ncbi:MAG: ABC transporter substrate-binding protein [Defluviitaleaceae bacterium]|nr:ABC transporter substrate-binding protein [Defluviitaleaceae bacterium]MCL2836230.1 ABC transporter substrate-binding protein [Defluviitaleaceae bacterium]
MKKSVTIFLTLLFMLTALSACTSEASRAALPEAEIIARRPIVDREGYTVYLPEIIETIISIGPSNTEILVDLGFGGQIISTDMFSSDVEGIAEGISVLDMMSLDVEFIINLQPDIIFITGMTRVHGDDQLQLVSDLGTAVVYMPISASIADIILDISFIAAVMDAQERGEEIIAEMEAEIDNVRQIAEKVTEERTVYFEISPAPWMYSFGTGIFLNEMIELAGAVNVFANHEGWLGVSDEMLLVLNPDVILTSTNFLPDPIADITDRPGWDAVTAVQNGDVFYIDANSSNRPSHNIVRALREIASAVYPELFPNPHQ